MMEVTGGRAFIKAGGTIRPSADTQGEASGPFTRWRGGGMPGERTERRHQDGGMRFLLLWRVWRLPTFLGGDNYWCFLTSEVKFWGLGGATLGFPAHFHWLRFVYDALLTSDVTQEFKASKFTISTGRREELMEVVGFVKAVHPIGFRVFCPACFPLEHSVPTATFAFCSDGQAPDSSYLRPVYL